MLSLRPWDDLATTEAGLAELRRAIVGETVKVVRYIAPLGSSWPEGHSEDEVHEVDMALQLSMESGADMVIAWAMDGLNEGLEIEFANSGEPAAHLPGDPVDVTTHRDWANLIGVPITSIDAAWHIPNEGCPEMPWAYRLRFVNRSSLVIASGEVTDERLRYLPDALLVFFDEVAAAAYVMPESSKSTFGTN